jgi:hypothetical protein
MCQFLIQIQQICYENHNKYLHLDMKHFSQLRFQMHSNGPMVAQER